MTAVERHPTVHVVSDASDMAKRLFTRPKNEALELLRQHRRQSIDMQYWDIVERELMSMFIRQEEEERATDKYYEDALSPEDRRRALNIVKDLLPDLGYAYKEIQRHIDYSRHGTFDRTFWMFIRRELNKTRRPRV